MCYVCYVCIKIPYWDELFRFMTTSCTSKCVFDEKVSHFLLYLKVILDHHLSDFFPLEYIFLQLKNVVKFVGNWKEFAWFELQGSH